MNIYNLDKQELELMSYQDIALAVLKQENKPMNTYDIFKVIADLLGFTENQFEKRLEDFFATISTNKNFILLEDGNWDLKSNHVSKIIKTDDDEDEELLDDEEIDDADEDESIDEDNYDDVDSEEDLLDEENDLEDLTILTEDELEEE